MSEDDKIATLIKKLKELRVQETKVLRQLEQAYEQKGNRQQAYCVGDRVYITSRVKKPTSSSDSWNSYDERRATVTKVVDEKVYIKTDNGTETWRDKKNLQLLLP